MISCRPGAPLMWVKWQRQKRSMPISERAVGDRSKLAENSFWNLAPETICATLRCGLEGLVRTRHRRRAAAAVTRPTWISPAAADPRGKIFVGWFLLPTRLPGRPQRRLPVLILA